MTSTGSGVVGLTRICAVVLLMLVSVSCVSAKGWRNIVPLHSTRDEVRLLLGVPTRSIDYADYYDLADQIVLVWYQVHSCDISPGRFGYGWNVPIGTVTDLGIIPKRNHRKEEFNVDRSWKRDDTGAGLVYYDSQKEGVSVETLHGTVSSLSYHPNEKDAGLECPKIEWGILDFFPIFDEYRSLPWEDEKARLDNYAIQMDERLNRGAIIVFGRNPSERSSRIRRAERARKYLYRKRSIHPKRLLILDGGYDEERAFRLNLHSIGAATSRIFVFRDRDPNESLKKDVVNVQ